MAIFLTSDCHFNHKNIVEYCPESRPFETVQEMNEAIIKNWNKVVSDKDDVYVLGDFFMGQITDITPILSRLKGVIHLVRGNHDTKDRLDLYEKHGVEILGDYATIKYKGKIFILNHFPLLDVRFYEDVVSRQRRDIIYCYGHVHDNPVVWEERQHSIFHVGVDTNNLTPVSIREIWEYSEK